MCSKPPEVAEDDSVKTRGTGGGTAAAGGYSTAGVAQNPDGTAAKAGAASVRYNNPGAQYPGKYAKMFGSTETQIIGGGHKIAVFDSPVNGAAAQMALLMGSSNYSGKTISSAVSTWSGGHGVQNYLNVIKRESGLDASTVMDSSFHNDRTKMIGLAKAMAWNEAGGAYPMTDAQWGEAYDLAMSKKGQ